MALTDSVARVKWRLDLTRLTGLNVLSHVYRLVIYKHLMICCFVAYTTLDRRHVVGIDFVSKDSDARFGRYID